MRSVPIRPITARSSRLSKGRTCSIEATFAECDLARAKETFHSTARQAAEIARDAHVKRLVIGHYSARYEDLSELHREAEAVFPGTILGNEGTVIPV